MSEWPNEFQPGTRVRAIPENVARLYADELAELVSGKILTVVGGGDWDERGVWRDAVVIDVDGKTVGLAVDCVRVVK